MSRKRVNITFHVSLQISGFVAEVTHSRNATKRRACPVGPNVPTVDPLFQPR